MMNRYLVRPAPGEWVLEHNGEAIARFATRESAVDSARLHSADQAAEVIVVGNDGRVVDHERRGAAPRVR